MSSGELPTKPSKKNEKYCLADNLLSFVETENKKRREDDVWIALIQNRIGSEELTIQEAFQSCFEDIDASRISQIDNRRMRDCLKKCGFERDGKFSSGTRRNQARYVRTAHAHRANS